MKTSSLMLIAFSIAGTAILPAHLPAQEPDTPSPFHVVEVTEDVDELRAETPRQNVTITSSRTHERPGTVDAAGLRRTLSSLIEMNVRLQDGEPAGRVQDVVIGPNGAVEYLVGESDGLRYLIPYNAARFEPDAERLTLPLTAEQFGYVPAFEESWPNLSSTYYRRQLFAAYGLLESRSGPMWTASQTVAKPVVPSSPPRGETNATFRPATDAAADDTVSAPGLPVLAAPQTVPQSSAPVATPNVQVEVDTTVPAENAGNAAPVTVPTVIGPIGGPRFNANRGASRPTRGAGNSNIPQSASQFPNSTPSRVNGSTQNTIGGVRSTPSATGTLTTTPPRFSGGGNTVGGVRSTNTGVGTLSNQSATPTTTQPTGTMQGANTPTGAPNAAPSGTPPTGGTSTTASPSGTAIPARTP